MPFTRNYRRRRLLRSRLVVLGFSLLTMAPAMFAATPQNANANKGSLQELEKAADAARERGDTQASLKLYQRVVTRAPSWQEGWFYLGSLQYDGNNYGEAVKAFRKLVQLNGELPDAWALLGLSEFELKDYAHAVEDLQKAEQLGVDEPLRDIADYHRALLMNERGDSDGALLVLSALYLRGDRSENLQVALGLSLLRVPLLPSQLDPSRDALVHDAGNLASLLAARRTDEADLAFRDMLSRYPKTQFLHYAYGGMLASVGHDTEAKAQFKMETELNPESALAYLEWAFVCMKSKEYEEAARLARRAIEINSDSFLAHYIAGNSLLLSADPAGARPELEQAKALAPGMPDIRYSLSRTYARLGEPALARQEQAEFLTLQRKNAMDRLKLQKRYLGAASVTGMRPITAQ